MHYIMELVKGKIPAFAVTLRKDTLEFQGIYIPSSEIVSWKEESLVGTKTHVTTYQEIHLGIEMINRKSILVLEGYAKALEDLLSAQMILG